MKQYKSQEFEKDCRICGYYNDAPLNIARAVTEKILDTEHLHHHEMDFEYYFFLAGEGILLINNVQYKYKTGDVFLIEPGEKHRMYEVHQKTDYITIRSNIIPGNKIIDD